MRTRSSGIGFTGLLTRAIIVLNLTYFSAWSWRGAHLPALPFGRAQYCLSNAKCFFLEEACSVAGCTEQCLCSTTILADEKLNPAVT